MFNPVTNIFIFAVYLLLLLAEFIFLRIFGLKSNTPWLVTTLMYIIFISYQILARTNELLEKGKVKEVVYSIMDSINGIPLVNKDGKIVIQWDIIFKKLIDQKQYILYDNIVKIKTKTIDRYVNQYPSILINTSTDLIEKKDKVDTKSMLGQKNGGDREKEPHKSEESAELAELKNKIFIKYVSSDKITIGNIDSSINVDFVMNDEFEPQEYEKYGAKPDARYDGFSVIAYYRDQKYVIVPRTMVFRKRIDKEKWLYQNIKRFMNSAESLIKGISDYGIVVDEFSLDNVLTDYIEEDTAKVPELYFECVDNNQLVFSGWSNKGKEVVRAFCSLETRHNGFEIKLVHYEMILDEGSELVEEDKTIAIGNSYQPLVKIMENMKRITRNIRLVILKKDIDDLVIK